MTLKDQILDLLNRIPNVPLKRKEISKELGIKNSENYNQLKVILWDLEQDGLIFRKGKKYSVIQGNQEFVGEFRITPKQLSFVRINNPDIPEIFINNGNTLNARPGDKVKVKIISGRDNITEGRIIDIIETAEPEIQGTLVKQYKNYIIIPAGKKISKKLIVNRENLGEAKNNDFVSVRIISKRKKNFQAKVIKTLSRPDPFDLIYENLLFDFGIPKMFPGNVLNEVEDLDASIPDEELKDRVDFRDKIVFTIDPDDAKDFDDAVSLEELEDGNYELGVHIADVSHYVRENSEIDKEAFRRGTSIYLPGKAVPMLPQRLTSEICSLQENKDKRTISVSILISTKGKVLDYKIFKSIINSKKRFSYEEAQKFIDEFEKKIDGNAFEKENLNQKNITYILSKKLFLMRNLSRLLFNERIQKGSIDFNALEPQFKFDPQGKIINYSIKERHDTHRLIEEFMLLANKLVASEIFFRHGESAPFIYRIHENPPQDKISDLKNYLKHFGIKFYKNRLSSPKDFQHLLESMKGTEHEYILNDILIRSMAKAVYAEYDIGHFGLGFDHYTHFTSPIRRYPDLIVHRFLKKYLIEKRVPKIKKISLSNLAYHSSETERRAMQIEREAIRLRQIEYLEDKTELSFDAIITNVINFGFFIEIPKFLISGLVHVKNLRDDYYHFDESKYLLRGEKKRKVFKLGDRIKVKLYSVDYENRKIDFMID